MCRVIVKVCASALDALVEAVLGFRVFTVMLLHGLRVHLVLGAAAKFGPPLVGLFIERLLQRAHLHLLVLVLVLYPICDCVVLLVLFVSRICPHRCLVELMPGLLGRVGLIAVHPVEDLRHRLVRELNIICLRLRLNILDMQHLFIYRLQYLVSDHLGPLLLLLCLGLEGLLPGLKFARLSLPQQLLLVLRLTLPSQVMLAKVAARGDPLLFECLILLRAANPSAILRPYIHWRRLGETSYH
mmetsp:Transcript_63341/g.125224  ORF Transcript_63341/g.125224 Transcript_63341/m.125224 type:complete len:242 (+) Transcript_63341:646-1371(+)